MTPLRLTLLLWLATATAAAASTATAGQAARQTLFFDAAFMQARTVGPPATKVGHLQIASGVLHNGDGQSVGRFASTCRWIEILANNDAREHCSGWGQTAEGRVSFAGPTRASDATHTWTISDGSGAYRGAHGTLVTRDLGDSESLLTVTLTPRRGITLRIGVIARPTANTTFRAQANTLCAAAAKQLAALPPFPLSNFDPLHPDPKLLPKVGHFFTGPGDPRPILRALDAHLRSLGQPPADTTAWAHLLTAGKASLAVHTEQDAAALTANVPAFVKSVHDVDKTFRTVAIAATVFGVSDCVS